MHNMIPAIVASGASPLVRVPAPENAYVKRALDAGAHGIMFPMIETAEQARAAVRYCKFPPQGMRGVGSPFAPTYFKQSMTVYQDSANEATMVLVQIETPLGLKNAFEIASVSGIGRSDRCKALLQPDTSPAPQTCYSSDRMTWPAP
jgi:4-hydroxy-2-oxoheptanedioate aldolase